MKSCQHTEVEYPQIFSYREDTEFITRYSYPPNQTAEENRTPQCVWSSDPHSPLVVIHRSPTPDPKPQIMCPCYFRTMYSTKNDYFYVKVWSRYRMAIVMLLKCLYRSRNRLHNEWNVIYLHELNFIYLHLIFPHKNDWKYLSKPFLISFKWRLICHIETERFRVLFYTVTVNFRENRNLNDL